MSLKFEYSSTHPPFFFFNCLHSHTHTHTTHTHITHTHTHTHIHTHTEDGCLWLVGYHIGLLLPWSRFDPQGEGLLFSTSKSTMNKCRLCQCLSHLHMHSTHLEDHCTFLRSHVLSFEKKRKKEQPVAWKHTGSAQQK